MPLDVQHHMGNRFERECSVSLLAQREAEFQHGE